MGKHDMPSLQFTVEGGRLVPAGPYEQEVLSTYSRGAQLTVTLNQKRSLPLLKKYWAVIRDVVDNCKTPWNSPDEASDAIKLALGVTDIGKTINDKWFIRPGSISFTSMDEAAFRTFFENAMAVLAGVTGIDPDELTKRYSYIAETDNSQSSEAAPHSAEDEGSDGASSSAVAAPDTAPQDKQEEGDTTGQVSTEAAPSSAISDEDRIWLIKATKLLVPCALPGGDPDVVRGQYSGLIKSETPPTVSQAAIAKAVAICKRLVAVCDQTEELDMDLIAGLAGCEVGELAS